MKDSKIEWTDHTFNLWIGCTKVSPGCANCYAASLDHRWGHDSWGPGKLRRRTSADYWTQPLTWDRAAAWNTRDAEACGRDPGPRPRVFCASLADWLDDEAPTEWLADLIDIIRRTPHLNWLLLTKRPQNWKERITAVSRGEPGVVGQIAGWWLDGTAPANVWIGTTVENNEYANRRIDKLISIPARVRFLSVEPMLEPVDLAHACFNGADSFGAMPGLHWVICGGESGPGARPMNIEWARDLRDQCARAGVAFFMKQLGGVRNARHNLADFPDDLRIRQFPEVRHE